MNTNLKLLIAALVGAAIATTSLTLLTDSTHTVSTNTEKKPLYWVAPMDSNYRRDEPGLSPMGMDLVPVYAEGEENDQDGPGAVTISPAVINNLGVRTAKVQRKALQSEVNTVGYVQYNQDQQVHIHPRVEGWLETLYVKAAGDQVKQGEPLYTLYSPQLVNAQEEFVLAVNRNNPVLIRAAKARLKALNVSDGFVERLQTNKKVMQNITFYARQSGVVDELNVREGFYVKPGTSMMSIAQLDEVWVEAEVFERQAQLIEVGLPVTMTLDYIAGQSWRGKVDYIYPTLDAKNRTLRVRLRFNNQDHQLKPNMFAQVSIHAKASEQQLIVPKQAVIRTGSQDRVVVALGEGRFKSVAVELGRSDNNDAVILAGIKADDEVVTSAQFLLDSESSKSSDFKRMQAPQVITSVWGKGVINHVMADQRMVNISHEPMNELDWPSMTMDFMVAESVDIGALQAGQTLHFELTKQVDGSYVVSGIHIMDSTHMMVDAANTATVKGTINSIDKTTRVANISRGAIEKWHRAPATMDFVFADGVDLTTLEAAQQITFTFSLQGGEFVISRIDVEPSMQSHSGH
ncbi:MULTISPECIES: efflux RND transporter periplasmic adaptor subunit [Pseudoalteromonas]|uniref:efflux RND transporter periplasmic adaptor subunit n=1 Tax=Pseudoalteromonas TaxID=53246 RepID=UPI0002F67239|nr:MULTISPECIES: efflux RND transporter periplasmic adaptor subunit [Pseudoalteromonas]MCF6145932.1 Cu(I)/Ag(I) efflux system membrane protein CusB/SilB [Pseudoalteromonas mariniglutinosa NCIMB 1770]